MAHGYPDTPAAMSELIRLAVKDSRSLDRETYLPQSGAAYSMRQECSTWNTPWRWPCMDLPVP